MAVAVAVAVTICLASLSGSVSARRPQYYDIPPLDVSDYCHANSSIGGWTKASALNSASYKALLATGATMELRQVQMLVRHGDRTPVVIIPGDQTVWTCKLSALSRPTTGIPAPHTERLYDVVEIENRGVLPGNCTLGQLTEIGANQHMLVGENLRQLYVEDYGFISADFEADEVYVRSTMIPRTIQSIQSELFTLFPNGTGPIPIHTMDTKTENMSPNYDACPKLTSDLYALQNTTAWKDMVAHVANITEQLASAFNLPYPIPADQNTQMYPFYTAVWDTLLTARCHDKTIAGISAELAEEALRAAYWFETNWFFAPSQAKLSIGTFLNEIANRIRDEVAGNSTEPYKMYMYSGQDISVAPLLTTLQVWDRQVPPYASHVVLELWEDTTGSDYYVRILYNGVELEMPSCKGFCPVDTFFSVIAPSNITPAQYAELCAST